MQHRGTAGNVLGASNETDLFSHVTSDEVIGYFKASNTYKGDRFGKSVALSADGNTLAVGSYKEASTSTSINGNLNDNCGSEIGAVYLY